MTIDLAYDSNSFPNRSLSVEARNSSSRYYKRDHDADRRREMCKERFYRLGRDVSAASSGRKGRREKERPGDAETFVDPRGAPSLRAS